MDAGDWIAVAAALIAVGSMAAAFWQAGEAGKSRKIANEQAILAAGSYEAAREQTAIARDAAESARTQAREAAEANALAREAIDDERAARDEAAGPEFTLSAGRRSKGVHKVTVTMVSGPPKVEVMLTSTSAPALTIIHENEESGGVKAAHIGPHQMVQGKSFEFEISVPDNDVTATLEAELRCQEIGGAEREWARTYAVDLPRPPRAGVFL